MHNNNIINNSTIERRLNKGIGKVAIKENKEAKKEERRWKNATQGDCSPETKSEERKYHG